LLLLGSVLLVGCQQQNAPLVQSIPSPSFDGPRIAAPVAPPPVVKSAPPVAAASGPKAWIPTAPARPWRWIVVHHSASPSGSAAVFDREHKAKGWDELGYHFVIGNGTNSGDGQIEVGGRWPKQKWGAHAKTLDNKYNEYGIGICLVGNFDNDRPTAKQMQSLATIVSYMMKTYHVSADRVIGHGDTKPTHCPGKNFNLASLRRMLSPGLADAADVATPRTASAELLSDVPR
jgi:hypothetical protein